MVFLPPMKDYMELNQMPANIHTEYLSANTLVFEDSFYNFGPDDYVDVFEQTGAQIAYCYGLLPYEVLFRDMPENPVYAFTITKKMEKIW